MQTLEKYKKYVDEHNDDFNNKKQISYSREYSLIFQKLSYSQTSNMYTFATMPKVNSMYIRNSKYFMEQTSEEPTEQIEYIVTSPPTSLPTNRPLEIVTKCPSSINSTYMPTNNLSTNNVKSNIENNNYNILVITFSILSFFLFFIMIYVYKYYYLRYKKLQDKYKKNERDLDFGLSYVDDF